MAGEPIAMNWKEYLCRVKTAYATGCNIYIYGAGQIGRKLLKRLQDNEIEVKAFLVTDASSNKQKESGLPVLEFNFREFSRDDAFILIAVRSPWNNDIRKMLQAQKLPYLDIIQDIEKFLEKPKLFEINACVGCVVSCKFCPQSALLKNYHGERMLPVDTFKIAIEKIPKDMTIAFSGFSEPFQNPDIVKMIQYANARGHGIWLNTTLVGMTMKKFEQIKEIPFSNFILHLPDEDENAHIPMTDEYFAVLDAVLDWRIVRAGKEEAVVGKANCQGEVHPVIKRFVAGRTLVFAELADRAGNLKDKSLHSVGSLQGPLYCNYSPDLANNVLMPNGDIVLCCMDFGLRHVLGNILRESYEEIRSGRELSIVRGALQEGADVLCRHCTEAKPLS